MPDYDALRDFLARQTRPEVMLSFEQVGAAAMLSRATAGTYRGAVIVSMPGSPKAVRLAWEKLLEPELSHLAWEVGR